MLTFENWLETRQGKFFKKNQLTNSELKKIYFIFKKNKFDGIRGVAIGECWHLQNEDGSLGIPGLRELGL